MRPLLILMLSTVLANARDYRGTQFVGFERFDSFQREWKEGAMVLVSSRIESEIYWDELIASWNFRAEPTAAIEVEAKALYSNRETKWFHLGKWSLDPVNFPRESVRSQKDADGDVDTDTLKLKTPTTALQLRLTLRGASGVEALKFLGLSFRDSRAAAAPLESDKSAWGKSLFVPERSQTVYPEGINEWCSPTSTSMILALWAARFSRPELDYEVPAVARKVHDPNWPGTGNWPFNTAFAGSHAGIRAYVTRFSDVTELEDWIKVGVPVAISVKNGWLKGRAESGNGHLVVCLGFDEHGDVIFNDPGRSQVRQTYARANVIKAWAASGNTVYLIYPEKHAVPKDRFGHWYLESTTQ
jgi:hypothetical protein